MPLTTILPAIAGLMLIMYLLATALGRPFKVTWIAPASLSAIFLSFSLVTVLQEGIWGFWINHSANLWGNQVWIDLLIAIGIAWTFIIPHARRLKMTLPIWAVAIVLTGCIGVLAMVARLMWLEEQAGA
ncbi:MAG: hypothetical protein HKN27_05250 [Silicimonas sp.]|nr:hypothetical protein [Silicimonas sp.]